MTPSSCVSRRRVCRVFEAHSERSRQLAGLATPGALFDLSHMSTSLVEITIKLIQHDPADPVIAQGSPEGVEPPRVGPPSAPGAEQSPGRCNRIGGNPSGLFYDSRELDIGDGQA